MHTYAAVCLFAGLVAAALGGGVIGRDPGLRATRLLGWIAVCIAYWGFCEAALNTRTCSCSSRWATALRSVNASMSISNGFVTKSYAPARIAATAVSMLCWGLGLAAAATTAPGADAASVVFPVTAEKSRF